jgi:hypothetical protein
MTIPKIGDIVTIRSTSESGIVLFKKSANSNFLNLKTDDYDKTMINVYYVLSTSARVHGPMFQSEFYLM